MPRSHDANICDCIVYGWRISPDNEFVKFVTKRPIDTAIPRSTNAEIDLAVIEVLKAFQRIPLLRFGFIFVAQRRARHNFVDLTGCKLYPL